MDWKLLSKESRAVLGRYLIQTVLIIGFSGMTAIISFAIHSEYGILVGITLAFWSMIRLMRIATGLGEMVTSQDLREATKKQRGIEQRMMDASEYIWKQERVPFRKWQWIAKMMMVGSIALFLFFAVALIENTRTGVMATDIGAIIIYALLSLVMLMSPFLIYFMNAYTYTPIHRDDWWPDNLKE